MTFNEVVDCAALDELELVLRFGPMHELMRVHRCSAPRPHLVLVFDKEDMRDAWFGVVEGGLSVCFEFERQHNPRVLYVYEKALS